MFYEYSKIVEDTKRLKKKERGSKFVKQPGHHVGTSTYRCLRRKYNNHSHQPQAEDTTANVYET